MSQASSQRVVVPSVFIILMAMLSACKATPIKTDTLVIPQEVNGIVEIEAETFFKKDLKNYKRDFYVFKKSQQPEILPDPDEPHLEGASGGAYVEILPDTRVTHDDRLIKAGDYANFFPIAGQGPEVSYKFEVKNTGQYFVWIRAFSTGKEDNGIHVGLNGVWPASGARLQWCKGKKSWTWSNGQRTDADHCGGAARVSVRVLNPGLNILHLSAREDGFEMDKIILSLDPNFRPE